jgi:flavin reductase (DIM6/NTAB) family NADH-FMN oxidoreductase RutF
MYFDFDAIPARDTYKLLTGVVVPRPIAWVITQSLDGVVNAAPFSFFNALSGTPPIVGLGVGERTDTPKDTARNIADTGEFVINLVSESLAAQMNITAIDFAPGIDELQQAGLETVPSQKVKPPRILQSPVALECTLWKIIPVEGAQQIILGRVQALHIVDEAVLDPVRRHIDANRLGLVGRMHGTGWYSRTDTSFQMPRLTQEQWQESKKK